MFGKYGSHRGRTAAWVACTLLVSTLVTVGVLNFAGILSPVPSGPGAKELASGHVELPAVYSVAEGDGSFPWNDSLGPLTFFIGWHARFAASVCLVNSLSFVNYSTCQALGGTFSPFETSGKVTVGLLNASYPVESFSFIEPPGHSDVALGIVQVNYTGGSNVSFSRQLAVLSSFPASAAWSPGAFPLPNSDDHFEFWFNVTSAPILPTILHLSGSGGITCIILHSGGLDAQIWTCDGAYVDQGRPSFEPEVTYTTSESLTADFDLWVW
jgi:hypothetical protein